MISLIVLTASLLLQNNVAPSGTLIPLERVTTSFGTRARVQNTTGKTIVALHFTSECPRTARYAHSILEYNFDTLVNYGSDQPFQPSLFKDISLTVNSADCQSGVDAILFADGTALGERDKLQIIKDRRLGATRAILRAQKFFEAILKEGVSAQSAVNDLKYNSNTDRAGSPDVREADTFATFLIVGALQGTLQLSPRLPGRDDRLPSETFLVSSRGYTLDQARAYLAKLQTARWQEDLMKAPGLDFTRALTRN